MHDIDRTQMEYMPELSAFETESFEYGEQEWSGEMADETILSEADELELAGELLGVSNEEELEQFLGNLLKKAGRAVGQVVRSPVGKALGGVLKGVAKKALPLAGGALGAYVGGPLGAKIGSGLASAAGRALGLEAETMEQEELEFEGARQFVRLAANTVQKAAAAPPGANPHKVAQAAAIAASRQLAPGLLGAGRQPLGATARSGRSMSGRWVRHGNKIVLYGV
ncbi:hypothetical protein [Pseudomonas oryzae]|uniref:Uncharacterized protein n=1 Tax=Pseudomonas oryzae TaxID=1392877 RepID=A0A1H1Q0A9_9PSED|nr:hypothetical protein [Pseudomonas oryzae]SDS16826.1 hypothetical protein SAMN05216221_1218 [Pseudomonas oryzae]